MATILKLIKGIINYIKKNIPTPRNFISKKRNEINVNTQGMCLYMCSTRKNITN